MTIILHEIGLGCLTRLFNRELSTINTFLETIDPKNWFK